ACQQFDRPDDLSSCDESSEIFEVARALPPGLVDAIVAGHAHAGLAHVVNGVAITESFSHGRAFGRIDLDFDRQSDAVVSARVFPPQSLCASERPDAGGCRPVAAAGPAAPADYEGRPVAPDPALASAMAPALDAVRRLQATPLGTSADTPIARAVDQESPLGNLFADALRASTPDADVAIVNGGARGGLRADLPRGPLTFGLLYDVFPFDNQVARLRLTGAELAEVLGSALRRGRPGTLGISGVRVRADCATEPPRVDVRRASGEPIGAAEPLVVITTEMLAAGGLFAPAVPRGGFTPSYAAPVAREVVADWLARHGGAVSETQFRDANGSWDSAFRQGCGV
ncbi:MAG: 5'-nucleotidase C-terminal domain-containing protein, partial [Acidobacteriota bacterium]|nr:5'-nucleotidase C-terminal domain-containing protein [Acidobacteriota bacterium]